MKSVFLMLFIVSLSSCNYEVNLFAPLEKIKIGSKKDLVLQQIENYKLQKIISPSNTFELADSKVTISFIFCANCINKKLEAIKLQSEHPTKTFNTLKESFKDYNGNINVFSIAQSTDMLGGLNQDSIICIYSSKVKFYKDLSILTCKRIESEFCWTSH